MRAKHAATACKSAGMAIQESWDLTSIHTWRLQTSNCELMLSRASQEVRQIFYQRPCARQSPKGSWVHRQLAKRANPPWWLLQAWSICHITISKDPSSFGALTSGVFWPLLFGIIMGHVWGPHYVHGFPLPNQALHFLKICAFWVIYTYLRQSVGDVKRWRSSPGTACAW